MMFGVGLATGLIIGCVLALVVIVVWETMRE